MSQDKNLPLWERDAKTYLKAKALYFYPLLLTMDNVDHDTIKQAIDELIAFYQDNQIVLSQCFAWMVVFLERTNTIQAPEKQKIWELLHMYDQLWEESPRVQLTRAQGELSASRKMALTVVMTRFPNLRELAEQQISRMTDTEALLTLTAQIVSAANEAAVRRLLEQAV